MTNILEEVDREVDGENDEKSGEKLDSNDSTRKSSGSDQNDNIKKPKPVKDPWGKVIKSKKVYEEFRLENQMTLTNYI